MDPLTLSRLESFYVGGEQQVATGPFFGSDETTVGAMYVQRLTPAEPGFGLPVLFIHGGMHTGATWSPVNNAILILIDAAFGMLARPAFGR